MAYIKVAIINESSVLTDAQVAPVVQALQVQVSRDFAPVWGIDAELTFIPAGYSPDPKAWQLVLLDNSDQAGALGYHDLTDQGLPLGKVFAQTDINYGQQWSVTASHELLEMLGDPDINLTALTEYNLSPELDVLLLYAYENCDPCESDAAGYLINGILVSDFVFPAWFEGFRQTGSTQFDYQNRIRNPFELLPGGYISVFDITSGGGWRQIFARTGERRYSMRAHVGSRRERRRTPRKQWLRSNAGSAPSAARLAQAAAFNTSIDDTDALLWSVQGAKSASGTSGLNEDTARAVDGFIADPGDNELAVIVSSIQLKQFVPDNADSTVITDFITNMWEEIKNSLQANNFDITLLTVTLSDWDLDSFIREIVTFLHQTY